MRVAAWGSATLIVLGLAGLVHSVLPWCFPFYTSSGVIKTYKALRDSGRHDDEIRRILGTKGER